MYKQEEFKHIEDRGGIRLKEIYWPIARELGPVSCFRISCDEISEDREYFHVDARMPGGPGGPEREDVLREHALRRARERIDNSEYEFTHRYVMMVNPDSGAVLSDEDVGLIFPY